MGLLEWECTVCLCPIKSSLTLIVAYPLRTYNENEIMNKMRLSTCAMKKSGLLKQTAQYFYWGPSLLRAEFVRGRVCQGPSLSGAEMSRNQQQNKSKFHHFSNT